MPRFLLAIGLLLGSVTSCGDITTATNDPVAVAGTYRLETSVGRYAPVVGTFVLTSDSRAERRVRYGSASATEYVATGTFSFADNGDIIFALNEPCGTTTCLWQVRGTRIGNTFTLEYPDPADGPPIQEVYFR
jgi:hypothetical protein